jgi:EAL domain-containing protein (putative c-di-GMP-specific phosphodiesterase class I)
VNVNVSAAQFGDDQYPGIVLETLRRVGLAPGSLTIELLESSLDASPALLGTLERLRESGVRIAVDDFGTGYSSLSRVAELPITELKLDRSVLGGARDKRMASAVARMGQTLGLRLVAEGIETSDELNLVHSLGYDAAQGYLMSRPVAAAAVETMLRSQASWRSTSGSSPKASAADTLCGWLASTFWEADGVTRRRTMVSGVLGKGGPNPVPGPGPGI